MPVIFSKEQLGKKRLDGFYETPIDTVKYMADKILKIYKPNYSICDPCVGDGVFINYLFSKGIKKENLYGYDIDEKKIKILKKNFKKVELFDSTKKFKKKFDIIIGNPPYAGDESYYIRENRDRLSRDYKDIKARNLFSIISYNSIQHLNEGGYFIKILSDAFLTNIYYKPFRDFILSELDIIEICLTPRDLFRHIDADIGTCILFGRKRNSTDTTFNGWNNNKVNKNKIKLIDRLKSQNKFYNNKKTEWINQNEINNYPNSQIIIGVSKKLRHIYINSKIKLGDIASGGTGISTGNDKKFLKKTSDVKKNKNWVPYYKNAARMKYFYNPIYSIEKNYKKNYKNISNYLIRNEKFFYKEGISCSSVGIRFSASYMPSNCLFGVNANFFFKNRIDLFYVLAFLNSNIAWYFSRKILIRTNNISANYLRKMPIIFPSSKKVKFEIYKRTKVIVDKLKKNPKYDFSEEEDYFNNKFYKIYNIDDIDKKKIEKFSKNFYEEL
ncbi:BREX-1 system adenine-specific DNA-methyltransferase PglX [Candidatus Pelagibacter sp.]|nr:BREX-1 system adenine-specific DNA-methyltransferase PglX [Candidatus Pelagibacter sp.]